MKIAMLFKSLSVFRAPNNNRSGTKCRGSRRAKILLSFNAENMFRCFHNSRVNFDIIFLGPSRRRHQRLEAFVVGNDFPGAIFYVLTGTCPGGRHFSVV